MHASSPPPVGGEVEVKVGVSDKINKIQSTESDYNHTAIVRNKQASWCFCGGAIRGLVHFKVKRIRE